MSNADIANTIRRQLGGYRFDVMSGARGYCAIERGLGFRLGHNPKRINAVRITLDQDDTYTMEFCKGAKLDVTVAARHEGVYGESLKGVFTAETGMATSL